MQAEAVKQLSFLRARPHGHALLVSEGRRPRTPTTPATHTTNTTTAITPPMATLLLCQVCGAHVATAEPSLCPECRALPYCSRQHLALRVRCGHDSEECGRMQQQLARAAEVLSHTLAWPRPQTQVCSRQPPDTPAVAWSPALTAATPTHRRSCTPGCSSWGVARTACCRPASSSNGTLLARLLRPQSQGCRPASRGGRLLGRCRGSRWRPLGQPVSS